MTRSRQTTDEHPRLGAIALRARPAGKGRRSGGAWRSWPRRTSSRSSSTASSPSQAVEWLDDAQPAQVPPLMGRRWPWPGVGGLRRQAAREDRALRRAARADRARQAAVLRHGRPLGGYGDRGARREPHGPADQDRGQPRPPRQPRRDRPVRRRPPILTLYDPDRSQVVIRNGPRQHLGRLPATRSPSRCASRPAGQGGGPADPDRDGHLADPGRQLRGLLKEFPEARWHSTSRSDRDAVREGAGSPSARTCEPSTTSTRPT